MSLLYLKHFDLNKSPFQITPDIDFFFSGSQRGGILNALIHVASHEEGIATAVAEVGSGKTLLARLMISRLPETICTVYLANPCFSRDEIISAIARDLGLNDLPASIEGKLALLNQELLSRHAAGQRVLLVIDEAHLMPIESIEEVRLLSNLETGQHKLINIMLFGQPELDMLLNDRRLRQVRDRVIHRFELPQLSRDETASYIDHRLRIAGWQGSRLFTPAATNLLLKASEGRARRINLLADKALLAAYADSSKCVEKRHVSSAHKELEVSSSALYRTDNSRWRILAVSLMLALPMTGLAVWAIDRYKAHTIMQVSTLAAPAKTETQIATELLNNSNQRELLPKVISTRSPASLPSIRVAEVIKTTEALLKASKLRGYTMQMATLPSAEAAREYIELAEKYVDTSSIYAHNPIYNGKSFFVITIGQYPNEHEVITALNALPDALKTSQPILRTWSAIARGVQQ